MRIVSWYSPLKENEKFGEVFPHPSLTDELDDEPIVNILNRFIANGTALHQPTGDVDADSLTSSEAVDEAFAHLEGTETSGLSKVEQAEVLATAERLVEQLQAQQAQQSENSAISEPGTQSQKAPATDELKEGKAE